jgi:Fe2+ or Zn2+ uptake regulation protein
MTTTESSVRLPKNYELIFEIIRAAGTGIHLTTSDVFAQAKARRPAIGFSTVYRGVQRLRDLGLIDEIVVPGSDSAVYELMGSPHAHFRCDRCGIVDDVDFVLPDRTIAELAAQTGAHVADVSLTLHGVCRSCRETAPAAASA